MVGIAESKLAVVLGGPTSGREDEFTQTDPTEKKGGNAVAGDDGAGDLCRGDSGRDTEGDGCEQTRSIP